MQGRHRPTVTERIQADQEIWFISDLHLGDGTPCDVFFGKDRHLMALVDQVERRGATLVIAGDAMDFQQAWTFTRILRAHQELLSKLSTLARAGRLYYIVGNHDYDISLYRELLNFRVCDELLIGDDILCTHGFEYDPYIGIDLEGSNLSVKVHHLVERYLNTWIRVPIGEFYTLPNRMMFWGVHKSAVLARAYAGIMRWFGVEDAAKARFEYLDYWARTQMGDPMCMYQPIMDRLKHDRYQTILCGHSHLPARIDGEHGTYINTGSWTFASSHYCQWDGQRFQVKDWITGRSFGDEFYRHVADGSIDRMDFWKWWDANYMGFLRFREGEERLGRLRGWESYIRDHQYLAQLQPLSAPVEPLPREPTEEPTDDDVPPQAPSARSSMMSEAPP